jgi:hypothetical protein
VIVWTDEMLKLAAKLERLAEEAHGLERWGPIKSAAHPLGIDPAVNGRLAGKALAYEHAARLVRELLGV